MGKAGQAQMPIQEAATAECTLKNKEEWGKQEAEKERESKPNVEELCDQGKTLIFPASQIHRL